MKVCDTCFIYSQQHNVYFVWFVYVLLLVASSVRKQCHTWKREWDIYKLYANILCERHFQVVIPCFEGDFAEKLIYKVEYRKQHPQFDSWTMNDQAWWTQNKEELLNQYKARYQDYFIWDAGDANNSGILPANVDGSLSNAGASTDGTQTDIQMDNGTSSNQLSCANNETAPSNPNSVGSQDVTGSLNTDSVASQTVNDSNNAQNVSSNDENDEITSTSDNGNDNATQQIEKSVTPQIEKSVTPAEPFNANINISDISENEELLGDKNNTNDGDIDAKDGDIDMQVNDNDDDNVNDVNQGFPHRVLDNDKLDLSNEDVTIRDVYCRLQAPFVPIVPKINHTWPYNADTSKYNVKELNGTNIMNTGGKYGQAREGSHVYFRSSLDSSRRKFTLNTIHSDSNDSSGTLWTVTECKDNSQRTESSLNFSLLNKPRTLFIVCVFR